MTIKIKSFLPVISLVASFLLAAAASYFIVMHLQHTLLQAWIGGQGTSSSYNQQVDVDTVAYSMADEDESDGDYVCGCPFCCSPPPSE